MKSFNRKVYEIVMKIPRGTVMSYGQIARLAGNPRASRAVGYAMHNAPDGKGLPCHRVIFKDGSLSDAFGSKKRHRELLKAEGIAFTKDRKVDMRKHCWNAAELEMALVSRDI